MREILRNSSGACFIPPASSPTSRAMLQKSFSIWARVRRSSKPRLNKSSASSRICRASCQLSNILVWSRRSHILYSSLDNSWAFSLNSSLSRHTGSCVVSSTSNISMEWWAVSERPLSVIMLGCFREFLVHTSTSEDTASLAYS